MLLAITADTPRNGSGSTTSSGVNSIGATVTKRAACAEVRVAFGFSDPDCGGLTDCTDATTAVATAEAATGENSSSRIKSSDGRMISPVGSTFGVPTGL